MEWFKEIGREKEFYTWNKGTDCKLSENFSSYEVECPCDYSDCRKQKIEIALIDKLQSLREELAEPLRINSGYRCIRYQDKLRKRGFKTAKKISQHSLGRAVDLKLARVGGKDFTKRFAKFKKACEDRFKAIGIGSTWLHVDMRDDRNRRWSY